VQDPSYKPINFTLVIDTTQPCPYLTNSNGDTPSTVDNTIQPGYVVSSFSGTIGTANVGSDPDEAENLQPYYRTDQCFFPSNTDAHFDRAGLAFTFPNSQFFNRIYASTSQWNDGGDPVYRVFSLNGSENRGGYWTGYAFPLSS